jgi:hypothetical protein
MEFVKRVLIKVLLKHYLTDQSKSRKSRETLLYACHCLLPRPCGNNKKYVSKRLRMVEYFSHFLASTTRQELRLLFVRNKYLTPPLGAQGKAQHQ